jgi:hypothetical protein
MDPISSFAPPGDSNGGELSEQELEAVVGGLDRPWQGSRRAADPRRSTGASSRARVLTDAQ